LSPDLFFPLSWRVYLYLISMWCWPSVCNSVKLMMY